MSSINREVVLRPIGSISTPFRDRYEAPRQPGVEDPAIGIITLEANQNFEQALHDLIGFDKIWLIYLFDRNPNWKPKVLPPRGSRTKRGVFATRSPHRPNPIGLSLVDLLEVKGRRLTVRGVDLLDGTPILDIKPYLRFVESAPRAKAGWLEAEEEKVRSKKDQTPTYKIRWSPKARKQADYLTGEFGIDLITRTEKILGATPEPHAYRRIKEIEQGLRSFGLKSWRIIFSVKANTVSIHRISSGYSADVLASSHPSKLHDGKAQKAFEEIWGGEAKGRERV